MRKTLFLTALTALALAGCGGSTPTAPISSLYRNAWTGTWVGPLQNDGGSLSFTILSDGSLSGTMGRVPSLSGPISGVIDNIGHITAAASFPSNGNFIITGAASLSNGHLIGSFSYVTLGSTYNGTFDLTGGTSG